MIERFLLALAVAATGAWTMQPAQGADERAIREARARSNAAIARHDPAGMAAEWMDDVTEVSSTSAHVVGRDANRARMQDQFTRRPDTLWVRTPTSVDVYAPWDVAAERGDWRGGWTEPDGHFEIRGTYQAQWRKVNGRWLLQAELFVPTSCQGSRYCQQRPDAPTR